VTAPVRTFLPWYRAGFAAALTGTPAGGAGRAAVPAAVRLRGEPDRGRLDVPMMLAGPGDVMGLDPGEVLRTEPFDGAPDFEPSYFPYIELASPDLPWRFTPEGVRSAPLPDPADAAQSYEQQHVRPWLALVVVPVQTSTLDPAAAGGLPVLHCPATELPDPAESWAWAHVQVTRDPEQPVEDALASGRALARLLCPHRLAGGVAYRACVVPTFAAGRAALLPGPAGEPLAAAWSGTGEVALPVYVQWTFATGPEGSFEELVRRLRPRPAPASAGGRLLAIGAPGWGAEAASPQATATLQGALRPFDVAEPELGDPVLVESLRTAVSNSGSGLELRPPIYGQNYQHGVTALPAGATGWLPELNTDPRRRAAAGLAAWAVAVHQEELADSAWRQLAAHRAVGRDQHDPALAAAVTTSLRDRHAVAAPVVPALSRLLRGVASPPAAMRFAGSPVASSAPLAWATFAAAAPTPPAEEVFAPSYDEPGYVFLRAIASEWLLPALGELPADTVAMAQTNGAFVESFLVGLNHALARELAWRRYPVAKDGTFFDRFWGTSADGTTLPPIAEWNPGDRLGAHTAGADQLVLLLRGALLQRFPTAAVYLSRPGAGGTEEQVLPVFSGRIGMDCVFQGFPLTAADVMESGPDRTSPWSVVVQESLRHARFGCDDPPPDGASPALASWQDLNWAHPQLAGRGHLPVAGPLGGRRLPASADSATSAVWGLNAASLAIAVQQPAFRVRIPVALWLRPLVTPPDEDGDDV
jgi:hypothetical protein